MFNIKKLVVLLLCAGLVFQAHFGIAGPQGGKVVGGNANISQSGPNTTINQTSDRAIINWNSFDIGKNESVRHNMPSSNSAGLHRVVGKGGPSQIEGLLQSNGNIYLVNPAGVVIHNGAKIDVNGFVATSRDIANDNFMKGKMVFDKPGLPGAAIINQGNISLRDNGLAALVAPTVRNDGIIAGKLGKVVLGGSDAAWKLDMTGDDLIAFTMDEKQVNTLYAADGTPLASVENNGKIKAEGGVVVLTASQLDGIVGSVVNNGEISAASAEMKGGKIIFRGQGNKVDVVNNGHLDVSSKAAEGGTVRVTGQAAVTHAGKIDATGKTKGGNIVITGENVTLKSGSRIDASGTNGGGTVLVGGNARGKGPEVNAKTTLVQSDAEILADANLIGDGGQIVVWADEKTQFAGKATAKGGENGGDGGMVETSAKLLIIGDPAVVKTSANKGKAGEWLLDPEDFVIAAAGGTMTGQQISDSLENNNVTIKVSEDGEGNGDIFVNDEITWNADTILTLNAYRDIIISNNIKSMGDNGGISIFPKEGNYYIKNSHISLFGKNAKVIINGEEYNIIKSMYDLWRVGLSGLPSGLSKKYVLICDIDLSSENWEAIGTGISIPPPDFSGVLEGFGNSINNLTINSLEIGGYSREWYPSLIASIRGGTIKNLYINNASIISEGGGGILARGISKNSIVDNVHVSGIITIVRDWKEGMGVGCGGILSSNFGIISNSSSDVTINFTDSSPKATIYIGSLVGTNNGIISSSYGTANINVNNVEHNNSSWNRIGGLVGDNYGTINNSYVIGNININSDETYTGGFVGSNSGTIKDSYSVSKIYGGTRGGFVGLLSDNNEYGDANPLIINCYWDTDRSQLNVGSGEDHIHQNKNTIMGLTAHEMCQQSSFKDWNFETIWKIDEGKSYPELRYVANNNIIKPDKPVDPIPPIVDPDPAPDPKPDTPDTPDNPDVPVNPDPNPDTPVNPDKPVNPDPKPDTPVTPDQPSRPGTNPGGTPSQPSTKPDTKPENPGTNHPVQPETPVVPEQPSKPVQPENPVTPEQPSNPGTTPGGNTPSQPDTKPETPVTPNQPSNPGNNSGSNNSNTGNAQFPTGTTITYKVIDGNVHVFQDNQHLGILGDNVIKVDDSNIPVEIEDGKTYVTGGDLQVVEKPGTTTQTSDGNSQSTLPSFSTSGHPAEPVSYDTFQADMNQFIRDVLGDIGKEFLTSLDTQQKADKKAINAVKKQINSIPPAPDAVYEAFAEFTYESLEGSDIDSFSTNKKDFFLQLIESLLNGNKSLDKDITIDGTVYTISGMAGGVLGKGASFARVSWINPDTGAHQSSTLYFASKPEETIKTLFEYQTALTNLATEEMREVMAYFIEDLSGISHKKARECVDVGEKIFNAMVDPQKGKELGKEMGEKIYEKLKGGVLGFGAKKFDEFLVENAANGGHIKEFVDKLKDVQSAFNKVKDTHNKVVGGIEKVKDKVTGVIEGVKNEYQQAQNLVNSAKELENNQNLLQAIMTLNDFKTYNSKHFNKIKQYLTQDS